MHQRAEVTNVSLTITHPGGQNETAVLPGNKYEGVFLNHRAVNKILAPFYKSYKNTFTREKLTASWGNHALGLMENKDRLHLTPQLVEDIWNLKNQNNILPPFMSKSIECDPEIPQLKSPGFEAGRARVTGITVELRHPDGRETSTALDPAKTEALAWSDRAALEILAPFYNTYESIFTRETFAQSCGTGSLHLMGGKEHLRITPRLIEELWDLEDQTNMLPPYMVKGSDCMPEMPEMKSFVTLKAA